MHSPLRGAAPCQATSAAQPIHLCCSSALLSSQQHHQSSPLLHGVVSTRREQLQNSHRSSEEGRNDHSSQAPEGSPAAGASTSCCASGRRWCPSPWEALGAASEEYDLKFVFSQHGLEVVALTCFQGPQAAGTGQGQA